MVTYGYRLYKPALFHGTEISGAIYTLQTDIYRRLHGIGRNGDLSVPAILSVDRLWKTSAFVYDASFSASSILNSVICIISL